MDGDARLRGGQEKRDHPQNLGIAPRNVIEPRDVDEGYRSPVESELVRDLNLGSARIPAPCDL